MATIALNFQQSFTLRILINMEEINFWAPSTHSRTAAY